MSVLDKIREKSKTHTYADVDIGLDEPFRVRSLSERDWRTLVTNWLKEDEELRRGLNNARIVQVCGVDSEGNRLFDDSLSATQEIAGWPAGIVEAIANGAYEHIFPRQYTGKN